MNSNNDIAIVTVKPKRRWLTVFALSAAAFVDSSENETISILWPFIYPALGLSIGLLGLDPRHQRPGPHPHPAYLGLCRRSLLA
ncbi:MAG: hypothetical protein MUO67_17870 [Anaerolineales bacterium]|nr:hypothetical protein [Anaerolineales bacterium]